MRLSTRSHRAVLRPVAPRRARRGFTLVEVILAMVLLAVGLLALASGSVGVMRQMRSGNKAAVAAMVAQARMEKLRSKGCSAISSGSATTSGMSEKWTVTVAIARVNAVAETVFYSSRAGKRDTVALKGAVPCL